MGLMTKCLFQAKKTNRKFEQFDKNTGFIILELTEIFTIIIDSHIELQDVHSSHWRILHKRMLPHNCQICKKKMQILVKSQSWKQTLVYFVLIRLSLCFRDFTGGLQKSPER